MDQPVAIFCFLPRSPVPLCGYLATRKGRLLTKIRKDIKHRVMRLWDKWLLRKWILIETMNDQVKNISQIEYMRHRSVPGLMVNLVACFVAYSYRPTKPSLGLRCDPRVPMLVM